MAVGKPVSQLRKMAGVIAVRIEPRTEGSIPAPPGPAVPQVGEGAGDMRSRRLQRRGGLFVRGPAAG
jgi:hypothetical protein